MWMLANSLIIRAVTMASQVVLSILLSKSDFGIWAIALSVSALVTNFRGGGILQWLIQGGEAKYEERAGIGFWTSLCFNTLLGAALCVIAFPAAGFFGDSHVTPILLISGLAFPLSTFGSFYKNSLAITIRMDAVSRIEVISSLVRNSLIIGFAFWGFGPFSFVLPLPVSYLVDAVLGYYFTRSRPWTRRANVWVCCRAILRNRWIMAGTLVITLTLNLDYTIIGRLASLTIIGIYYFAYQMTFMTAALVTENARRVLAPSLVALPVSRRPGAALSASRTYLLLGSPLMLLLACVIRPLENLVWHGKWADAIVPIQVMSFALPLQLMTAIVQASLQGNGRFRLWTGVNFLRACLVAASALVGGLCFPRNIAAIATIMAIGFVLANGTQVLIVFLTQRIALRRIFRNIGLGLCLAPICALPVLFGQYYVTLSLPLTLIISAAGFLLLYVMCALVLASRDVRAIVMMIKSVLPPKRSS